MGVRADLIAASPPRPRRISPTPVAGRGLQPLLPACVPLFRTPRHPGGAHAATSVPLRRERAARLREAGAKAAARLFAARIGMEEAVLFEHPTVAIPSISRRCALPMAPRGPARSPPACDRRDPRRAAGGGRLMALRDLWTRLRGSDPASPARPRAARAGHPAAAARPRRNAAAPPRAAAEPPPPVEDPGAGRPGRERRRRSTSRRRARPWAAPARAASPRRGAAAAGRGTARQGGSPASGPAWRAPRQAHRQRHRRLHPRKLDDAALEELEETLIAADLGVAASARIVEGFRRTRFGKESPTRR